MWSRDRILETLDSFPVGCYGRHEQACSEQSVHQGDHPDMATFVLIHGAGDVGWFWHLVEAELRARGHDVVAPDLPCDDESAGLEEYATTVVDAIGDRSDLVVVAQSFGGYTAPLVCDRLGARLLVLVAGMVPMPGESAAGMFAATGYEQPVPDSGGDELDETESMIATFYADVPRDLAIEALSRGREQAQAPWNEPWPLASWPELPIRYLLCRNDRLFPAEWVRSVVSQRLGFMPDEIDSGHCPALSRPRELAEWLEASQWEQHEAPVSGC